MLPTTSGTRNGVVFMAAAVVLLASGILYKRRLPQPQLLVVADTTSIPADGQSDITLSLDSSDGSPLQPQDLVVLGPQRRFRSELSFVDRRVMVRLTSGVQAGEVPLRLEMRGLKPAAIKITLTPSYSDTYGDGTPDFLRLDDPGDRDAFRRWFAALAEYESLASPGQVAPEINDCAALIRFAYRGALHNHDAAWMSETRLVGLPSIPSVRKYEYPFTPLEANLFRVRAGEFSADDTTSGAFAQFADAKTLKDLNAHFVSRDVRQALPGD